MEGRREEEKAGVRGREGERDEGQKGGNEGGSREGRWMGGGGRQRVECGGRRTKGITTQLLTCTRNARTNNKH